MKHFYLQHPEGIAGRRLDSIVTAFTLDYFPRCEAHVIDNKTMLIKAPDSLYSEAYSAYSDNFICIQT